MAENGNTPLIRFKGFTDAWEQHKLGNLGTTYAGLFGKNASDFGHGNANFVPYLNIFNNPITDISFLESVEIDNRQNLVKNGDIFFTTSSETPDEVGMSSVWTGNLLPVYLNSFCFGYRPKFQMDSKYMAFLLRSPSMRKKIVFLAQGISRYNISKNKMMEISIPLPANEEQRKVGLFLYSIDSLITLHQRKYEALQNVKKSLLEKMFPNDSSNVPTIRFKGFTDAWEQLKFSDLYVLASEGGTPSTANLEYYIGGTIPFVKIEDTECKYINKTATYITELGLSKSSAWLVPPKSVLFTNGATIGNVAIANVPLATKQGIVGIVPKKIVDTEFLYYSLSGVHFQNEVRKKQAVGTFATIILRELNNIDVYMPSLSEQQNVSGILSYIDTLITLHQRKYEILQNVKKSLLEKMFV